jgi:DNA mismatch repair protein MutS
MPQKISQNTAEKNPNDTPLMKQFWELKEEAKDAMLLFRMGDFYELFGDDAVEASRILEITLTSRDKGKENALPMAGVPHHSIQGYLQRLLDSGKKVALAEQLEDPSQVKGIVKRGITRTFTPAVQFDLEAKDSAYLAFFGKSPVTDQWILACLDPSTGESLLSRPMASESLLDEILSQPIRHLIYLENKAPEDLVLSIKAHFSEVLLEKLPGNYLSQDLAEDLLKKHYQMEDLSAFFESSDSSYALGVLMTYVLRTQNQTQMAHLQIPKPLHEEKNLKLGPRTTQHLDLIPKPDGTPSLLHFIQKARSSLGARQLKRWIQQPLSDVTQIHARQNGVQELSQDKTSLDGISKIFAEIYDLERIMGRVNTRLANPRDTLALGKSLKTLSSLKAHLKVLKTPLWVTYHEGAEQAERVLQDLSDEILRTQKDDAPLVARDAGIFEKGTTDELDHLMDLTENGRRWLIDLETREREATGISSLKVRYNRVFGYFIEITKSHLKNVPSHYQRKQSMVNAERFFTEELKTFEEDILTSSSRQKALEQALFEALVEKIQKHTGPIMKTAKIFAEVDAIHALAKLAWNAGWCFPTIDKSLDVEIKKGRHPLVDATTGGSFVPNDLTLSPDSQNLLIITGPNMGGKSTIMRQMALIVILGQMGAPVPALEARWGVFSSIYTRIGAHDAISRGQSTFMVEMSELAHILHFADQRSLIVLDEIGRGTSTYDGISVAWSTLEWIANKIQARTLFATHYHELTRLDQELPGVANAHMAVDRSDTEEEKKLRFLYELQNGPSNESFGVHVARLAGLPAPVVERAWKVLAELEENQKTLREASGNLNIVSSQMSLFGSSASNDSERHFKREKKEPLTPKPQPFKPHPLVEELSGVDCNSMTPIQALTFLAKLKETLKESDPETA